MDDLKNYTIKLDMNAQIISLLSRNVEISDKVSRFQFAVGQFISNQKKLEELHSILVKDITIPIKNKDRQRKELEESIMPVVRIMQVFAYDKKKKKLQERLEYLNIDYTQNCSDFELIKISKKIWLIANKNGGYSLAFISKNKSSLNPDNFQTIIKFEKEYGLTPAMIKNIEETNIKFIESLLVYQSEIKGKNKVSKKMKNVFKQSENLLINKIDKFVFMFENENKSFYNEYFKLRKKISTEKKLNETLDDKTLKKDVLVSEVENNQAVSNIKPDKTPVSKSVK